jgi:hypothetical protein
MIRSIAIALVACSTILTFAQTQPAPASAPATTQRARYEIITPPGFQKVKIGEHTVIAEPIDLPWIQETLANYKPTTRPTTMPATLLATLKQVRPQIEKGLADDVGITDPKLIAELFDQVLYPNLQKMADLQAPLFYLVTSKDKLKEVLKNGWSDPRLHYNKVTDEVQFASQLELNIDRELDDYVVPAIFPPTALPDQKRQMLDHIVDRTEAGLAGAISVRGQAFMHTAIMNFIGKNVFAPLKPDNSQEWLSMGVSSTLAAKYTALANQMEFKALVQRMTADRPQNPISPRTIDLAHPTKPEDLRREAIPFYIDALGRKAMVVTMKIYEQGGPNAIKKIVEAWKKESPKDGDALVAMIKNATGVDVSEDVKAK